MQKRYVAKVEDESGLAKRTSIGERREGFSATNHEAKVA